VLSTTHRRSKDATLRWTTCLLGLLLILAARPLSAEAGDDPLGAGGYPTPAPKTAPLGAFEGPLQMPSASQKATDVNPAALEKYTKKYDIGLAEATRRLLLQTKVHDLEDQLVNALGDGYAQNWFDNAAGKQVVAIGPDGDPVKAAKTLTGLGYAEDEFEVVRVGFGYRDVPSAFRGVAERARAAVGRANFELAMEPRKLVVTMKSKAALNQTAASAIAAAAARLPVEIRHDDSLPAKGDACGGGYCSPHLAGAAWYGPNGACTQGFLSNAGGGWYFMSAGHCVAGAWSPPAGNGQRWNTCAEWSSNCGGAGGYWAAGYYQNYAEDMGIHQFSGPEPGHTVIPLWAGWVNWWNSSVTTLHAAQNPQIGSYICLNGITSGSQCGYVGATNTSPYYSSPGSVTLAGMIRVDQVCALGGDSGGPWTFASSPTAAAIHSGSSGGGCPRSAYVTAVGTISSVMGVTVTIGG
jgi:hypothetical protein